MLLASLMTRRATDRSSHFNNNVEKARWLVELPTSTPTDNISSSFISMCV
jgi:hypothetical protein